VEVGAKSSAFREGEMRTVGIVILVAALAFAASMYRTPQMELDAIVLAMKSCKTDFLKQFPQSNDLMFIDARTTLVLEGCMAARGYEMLATCESLSAKEANPSCYYRPRTNVWDYLLRPDLIPEIYQTTETIRKMRQEHPQQQSK
jgi:hypothetical protein